MRGIFSTREQNNDCYYNILEVYKIYGLFFSHSGGKSFRFINPASNIALEICFINTWCLLLIDSVVNPQSSQPTRKRRKDPKECKWWVWTWCHQLANPERLLATILWTEAKIDAKPVTGWQTVRWKADLRFALLKISRKYPVTDLHFELLQIPCKRLVTEKLDRWAMIVNLET